MRGPALFALAALAIGPAMAQPAPDPNAQKALTASQERMRSCNAEAGAKHLAGDARQRFMSDCLSAGSAAPAAPPLSAQQQRMRDCNAEAGNRRLGGEERQRFMSGCLAGGTATGSPTTAPLAADSSSRFASESQAKRACGGDAVVWANPDSQVFHAAGTQYYGKTQQGGYMCRAAAEKAGFRPASGGKS